MPEVLLEEEHPFVSEGFVSLTKEDAQVPVKILRDTGASQSLMLQNVVPLSNKTSTDANVLIQGVELNTTYYCPLTQSVSSFRFDYWSCGCGDKAHIAIEGSFPLYLVMTAKSSQIRG